MSKEMRKRFVSLSLAMVALALAAQSDSGKGRYDIGNDLGNSLESWEQSADDFAVEYGKIGFGFAGDKKRGVPLFWSVQLGLYPEAGVPQVFGGHMRLIIGYNAEKNEIIYTDTWGAGHEHKYMPDDWAWTITQNMFYLNPR